MDKGVYVCVCVAWTGAHCVCGSGICECAFVYAMFEVEFFFYNEREKIGVPFYYHPITLGNSNARWNLSSIKRLV